MKFVIVLAAVLAVAIAAAVDSKDATVLRFDSNVEAESYKYGYETSDGKSADEEGYLKNVGTDDEAISVKGSYRYIGDDGVTYEVSYIADENGFQPSGAHLPVA